MRGKGCWRLGGSVTEISKTREAAGGWLRLEDEGNGLFGWQQRKESVGAVSGAVGWRRGVCGGCLVAERESNG
jgi:hypothetical protein